MKREITVDCGTCVKIVVLYDYVISLPPTQCYVGPLMHAFSVYDKDVI
jgi:hypothetical protein